MDPFPHGSPFIFPPGIRIRIQYADLDPGGENLREKTEIMQGNW